MKKQDTKTTIKRDDLVLDNYEKEVEMGISKAVDKGDFVGFKDFEKRKEKLSFMAKNTKVKQVTKPVSKTITMTRDEQLLEGVKAKAAQEGIKYQTFIKSIIHKYINGYIK